MKEVLKTVIADQKQLGWKGSYIERKIPPEVFLDKSIVVISGIRRCGKSTLLQQIRNQMDQRDYYLNFDDDRLIRFSTDDFQSLYEVFIGLFGEQQVFYFDEIQNVSGWELFVRRLADYGFKVFITGSNARMLSRELGTHLTGRYIRLELFPFSFIEYLEFRKTEGWNEAIHSTQGKAMLVRAFEEYLVQGGFPTYLETLNDLYIKSLYESILYRDVLVRNRLTNEKELLELVYFLASNFGKLSTNLSLAKVVGVKNATTIRNYLSHLTDSYLIYQVPKYDPSISKQIQNPRKTYFIDNALVLRLGFSFSPQSGRLLENVVFIELKRRGYEVYYHSGKSECDFLLRVESKIVGCIQVCYTLEDPETWDREIRGLTEALDHYSLDEGFLLVSDTPPAKPSLDPRIKIMAVWRWMVEGGGKGER